MIEIEHLVKRFGPFTAVDDISFTVARGEVLGFLGPNGAGKSTTMKMAAGFLAPSAGRIRIAGHDVERHPLQAKAALGYLPEGAPAYGDMTPRSFLRFVARVRGLDRARARDAVDGMVAAVELEGVLEQPIDTLSKGFKRRVGLAGAILHDPPVLILDEPTDGLDPNQKHEVRSLIRRMAPEKAIIISTHILDEVEALCSRALIIDRGRVVADGTPEALAARSPEHNGLSIRLARALPGAALVIGAAPGVREVVVPETAPEGRHFIALAEDGGRIREGVAAYLAANGIEVDGIEVAHGRLDDVFRMVTTRDAERLRA